MTKIVPAEYHRTVDKLIPILKENDWNVTPFGVESLPSEIRNALQLVYNMTNLYVRTRPDLLATRSHFDETYLIECKDWTPKVEETGNYSVEAVPWFVARHLRKMRIRYYYAIDDPKLGMWIIRPDKPPFSRICTILLPLLHKEIFEREIVKGLRMVFPTLPFNVVQMKKTEGGDDPFILIPRTMLPEGGRSANHFAKWGWP